MSLPGRAGPPVSLVSPVENIQEAAPVTKVSQPSPVVIVVRLGGPQPGQVVTAVVIQLVESDDQVPHPGGGEVGPHHHGAQGHCQHAVKEEVQGVTVGCSSSYGSLPVVVGLRSLISY